jgi:hypothetical protein
MTDDKSLRSVHNMIAQLDDVKHRFGFIGEYEQFLHAQVIPHFKIAMHELDPVAVEMLAEALDLFLQEYAKMVAFECTRMTKVQLKEKLKTCNKRLQECALDFLQAQTCIDYILIGMRKPSYVMQVMGGL